MAKLVYGIGINDKTRGSKRGVKPFKEYYMWHHMLLRCTEKFWDEYPTYSGTTCSENFKSYAYFYEWCQEQVGFGNKDEKGKDWHLDKDLLIKGNKLYSEDTCVFIPRRLNLLLTKCDKVRGNECIGVYKDKKGGFMSTCRDGGEGKVYLGRYATEQEAFQAYKIFKENLFIGLANDFKHCIDKRAYLALLEYKVGFND